MRDEDYSPTVKPHPVAAVREAELRLGLADGAMVPEADFQAWADTPDGDVPVLLATFAGIDPPFAAVERAGLTPAFVCRWITLTVHSGLAAVGLTAAVARALAHDGIACNVVAGTYHDHLFVPADRVGDAMAALQRLQRAAARPHTGTGRSPRP